MKATLVFFLITLASWSLGQEIGSYTYYCSPPPAPEPTIQDSLPRTGLPIVLRNSYIHEFPGQTLIIRRFGRFKLTGSDIITTYGLNTDNLTVYGRYEMKNDTLILKCRYSIQHFNKLAPKRRVKRKLSYEYSWVLLDDGRIQTSEFCYWKRKKIE